MANCEAKSKLIGMALGLVMLTLWLCLGMVVFNHTESPKPASQSSLEQEEPIIEVIPAKKRLESRSFIVDVGVPNPPSIKGLGFLLDDVSHIVVERFENETSSYANITYIRLTEIPAQAIVVLASNASKQENLPLDELIRKWDLSGSLFFSLTLVTTIGFGSLAPVTRSGKAFCIFYALIGIPLCFNVMRRLLETITLLAESMANCFFHRSVRKKERFKKLTDDDVFFLRMKATLTAYSLLAAIYLGFVLASAWLISFIEGWSYQSSLYYCFISITTIGFGDKVPGQVLTQNADDMFKLSAYKIYLTLFTFIGVAFALIALRVLERLVGRFMDCLINCCCGRCLNPSGNSGHQLHIQLNDEPVNRSL